MQWRWCHQNPVCVLCWYLFLASAGVLYWTVCRLCVLYVIRCVGAHRLTVIIVSSVFYFVRVTCAWCAWLCECKGCSKSFEPGTLADAVAGNQRFYFLTQSPSTVIDFILIIQLLSDFQIEVFSFTPSTSLLWQTSVVRHKRIAYVQVTLLMWKQMEVTRDQVCRLCQMRKLLKSTRTNSSFWHPRRAGALSWRISSIQYSSKFFID